MIDANLVWGVFLGTLMGVIISLLSAIGMDLTRLNQCERLVKTDCTFVGYMPKEE